MSSIYAALGGNEKYKRESQLQGITLARDNSDDELANFLRSSVKIDGAEIRWKGERVHIGGDPEEAIRLWASTQGAHTILNRALIDYISASQRLEAAKNVKQIDLLNEHPSHPFHMLYKAPEIERRLSDLSRMIFGTEVSLNPGAGSVLSMHVGPRVDPDQFGGDRTQEYGNQLARLPVLEVQGDGVQATLGLLSKIVTSTAACILIDEPDLYMHPPQASELARALMEETKDKQVFLATHSIRFLLGLFQSDRDRLKLLRLVRDGNGFSYHEVPNEVLRTVKADPVLKFTNVLEALFFGACVICEDPADCLLFKTAMEKTTDLPRNESTFWIGAYGKQNLPKIARIVRAMNTRTVCIADFDALSPTNNCYEKTLIPLFEILGGVAASLRASIESAHRSIDGNNRLDWKNIKNLGIRAFSPYPRIHRDFELILDELLEVGIVVIPNGEMENVCDPSMESKGAEAVNEMLAMDIANDPRLQGARDVCAKVATCIRR